MNVVTAMIDAVDASTRWWELASDALVTGEFADFDYVIEDRKPLELAQTMQEPRRVESGALLWVTPEMCELLEYASNSLQPQPFEPDSLPWSAAFVAFATPITAAGKRDPLAAVSWAPVSEGQHVIVGLERIGSLLVTNLWTFATRGSLIGETLHDTTDWDIDGWARMLSALWLLVQQRVAVVRRAAPSRPDVRRWARHSPTPVPQVTVVELRRPNATPHEDSHVASVDWSHRWMVDGHWRNQWYPRLNAHVPVWIAPYVKGPDDKPFVVKRRISAWVR